ncbi:MAG: aminodeoxychorismate synthase component I [Candidatus Omnitrophica bacterium]|nr:aminodeoxychorismate synthase component I [Candidatus Omnitrophota bacterium]MBU1869363.1 aminodeoxychorismate synthase component I [Candidatus Omnitrophota bacterium]
MAYYILKSYKLSVDPLKLLEALKDAKNCFFLDSSLNQAKQGRFSFLGAGPFHILESKDQNPFPRLKECMQRWKIDPPKKHLPFMGGAVGFVSYDLGFILEAKVRARIKQGSGVPEAYFAFYNSLIAIDSVCRKLYLFSTGIPEKSYLLQKKLCEENLKELTKLLSEASLKQKKPAATGIRPCGPVKSNLTKKEYIGLVKRVKEYIRQGDIYQVNLSQEFRAKTESSAFDIYAALRSQSPSHFSAYFDTGDLQILSSSPERFLKVSKGRVTTRPMKGTRARSLNQAKDKELKDELLKSAKDKAELMMIVDLERNDLGRVCDYESIRVRSLREIEKYRTVFQATANIEGRLFKNKDRTDLLRATFPGGSITGCPKIRAMQIIEELEPHRRSIYTGALGYLSFCGNMDFNILIRTILKKGNSLSFGVGGGIVADSDPQAEYEESLVKARGIFQAIGCRD